MCELWFAKLSEDFSCSELLVSCSKSHDCPCHVQCCVTFSSHELRKLLTEAVRRPGKSHLHCLPTFFWQGLFLWTRLYRTQPFCSHRKWSFQQKTNGFQSLQWWLYKRCLPTWLCLPVFLRPYCRKLQLWPKFHTGCEELLRCPVLLPCLRISLCRCVPCWDVAQRLTIVPVAVCC